MNCKTPLVAVAVGAVALTLLAVSVSGREAQVDMVLDSNADNAISLIEAVGDPRLSTLFRDLDANVDGSLSRSEMEKFQAIYTKQPAPGPA